MIHTANRSNLFYNLVGPVLLGLGLLAAVFQTLAIAFGLGGEANQILVGDLTPIPVNLLLSALLGWIARQHQGRRRQAWTFLSLAILCYAMGDAIWAYIELVQQTDPFPSLADVAYLIFPVLLLLGMLHFFQTRPHGLEGLKLGLDVSIIVAAATVVAWSAFLVQTIEGYGQDYFPMLISLAYPVADLAILGLLLLLVMGRQGPTSVYSVTFLFLGLLLLPIADFAFNIQVASDAYVSGTLWDTLWSWSSVLLGLAAYADQASRKGLDARLESLLTHLPRLGYLAPYLALVVAYGVLFATRHQEGLAKYGTEVLVIVVTFLVIVRQAVAFRENALLTQQLKALSENLEQRVVERTRELEDSQEKLVASEKLATFGRLTAGLAHEINTPLAASMNHLHQAQQLSEEYQRSIGVAEVSAQDHQEIASELLQSLDGVSTSLERLGEFVRKMRSMGRNPTGNSVSFDPAKVINETIALLTTQAHSSQVKLYFLPPSVSVSVYGESGRLSQVLTNLLGNAIHACEDRRDPQGSWVKVFLGSDERFLTISVQDNGSGIPEEAQRKIFEPMFTTKEVGRGTGLGLAIIQDIVKGHFGGSVRFETKQGVGTTFILQIPLERTKPAGEAGRGQPEQGSTALRAGEKLQKQQ